MLSTPYIFNEAYEIISKTPSLILWLEISLIVLVLWLILYRTKYIGKKLTAEQKAELLEKWMPEPLVSETNEIENSSIFHPKIVTGIAGKRICVDGVDCLNLATHNYLGFVEDVTIQGEAIKSARKYGVGSCGPRGFYGTLDVHLELEERLAKFMDMEEAVVYSYGFSTIASAIPAYCKRGDLIFVDESVNFAIQKGLDGSRSKIVYFKHNDMKDLENRLLEQAKLDRKNPKKAAKQRRFLIAEAIYMNTGEMCPLRKLVELRQQHKLRFFLDESLTFGIVGKNGRGLTELLDVDRKEIDMICGTLENAVGSIGGFCVGTTYIIDHQRLSGLGYCFSASAPPLLTQAAISALDRFEREPKIFHELNDCSEKVQRKFENLNHLQLRGHPLSPIKHLYLKQQSHNENEQIEAIVNECVKKQLAIINAEYLQGIEKFCPRPSIRISVNRLLSDSDIDFAFDTLNAVTEIILK